MEGPDYFISDNAAGVHPDVLAALAAANEGHAVAYGHDDWTERATGMFREHFGAAAEVFLTLTGTGANVLALQSVLRSFEAVICADCAHMNRDECGAPEKFTGVKLLSVPSSNGKLSPADIAPFLRDTRAVHRVQPRLVSVSQCTEWGTVYTRPELRALAEYCHEQGMLLHVDGARLCNAAVSLDLSLKAITADCGVDLVSFGGTKNGLMGAEALIVLTPELAREAAFFRKQAMQLCSKMRFVAAQFVAMFGNELWRRNAERANAMAERLAAAVSDIEAVRLVMPVESNVLFVSLPPAAIEELRKTTIFAVWDSHRSIVRWMTSFDTTEAQVDRLAGRVRDACRGG